MVPQRDRCGLVEAEHICQHDVLEMASARGVIATASLRLDYSAPVLRREVGARGDIAAASLKRRVHTWLRRRPAHRACGVTAAASLKQTKWHRSCRCPAPVPAA